MSIGRSPDRPCWHCGTMVDSHSPLDADAPDAPDAPEEGAVSFCLYCGIVGLFDAELRVRPPTPDELEEMQSDAGFRAAFVGFSWARQRVFLPGVGE